ncbi:pleckstrin homology domain-containing family G member 3 [Betta splendens]|uniref:Pleckstrin homology domain-containing family G member 3 n=1 Tax=Betta splendens TaxID=158456 RepID=A0A9W2XLT4_BETSP|nr:pleckstrin homology domain-containing family G member 3 [Betta splendens]
MPEGSLTSSNDASMSEESPRLSTASISSNERAPSATASDSLERPASLISTLSSGSESSRDDPPSTLTLGPKVNLDLSPQPDKKGQGLRLIDKDKETTPIRASSRRYSPFVTGTMAPNPQLSYLDRVVMEIIETERMYVRDLRMIVEDYLAHIIDQSDLSIHPEQVCALFGNIEDIYEFNSDLLQALDLCDSDPVAIARCFVEKSEYFEIYTQYCTNYPNSVGALTECMRNKSLAKFFRDRQSSLKRTLPLGSYLLKPVQRILKYHLLLQEIAKHFDPEEDGYEVVEEAIYTMTGVAWYINDMKRKHEHAVRLQEIQSLLLNWKGPDLTTYGELVLEGTFKVYKAKNERTLFLFDRMLLITKRRGEHFVYKTHISCSTLMLIESAKDSLSFSIIHYKHPKQPHTVQAKTVEEKKLWSHHIKRLILENHQAIIPQKAKDAILEMDSIYPSRYRYSPERLKKAVSSQSDLTKSALKSSKEVSMVRHKHFYYEVLLLLGAETNAVTFLLQSDSTGVLAEPSAGSEDELGNRRHSLEPLICSDEEEGTISVQRHQTEESELDELLLEDKQVDDFASSLLAAIPCWHFRVQTFLSIPGTGAEGGTNNDKQQIPEAGPGETKPMFYPVNLQPFTDNLPKEKMPEFKQMEDLQTDPYVDQNSPNNAIFPQSAEVLIPEGHPEPTEEPCRATPDSDAKVLSSAESSEDEEKGSPDKDGETTTSILPSSVLDQASAIAQHFNSIKRGSLGQDATSSLGCCSPRVPSRTNSILSLIAEPTDRPTQLMNICSDLTEAFNATDLTMLSPREDNIFEANRGLHRRRQSTLSKQDQLLLGKIKNYYENAGNQDVSWSLRRRESLTYIPAGLVKSSVSRLNSIQTSVCTSSNLDPLSLESQSTLNTDTRGHVVSSDFLDSWSEQRNTDPDISEENLISTCKGLESNQFEEQFRPSSDMIRIWQAMEQDISVTQCEDRGHEQLKEALRSTKATALTQTKSPSISCDPRSGADPSTTEIPTNPMQSLKNTKVSLWAPVPRVAQLKAEAEERKPGRSQQDGVERSKSKVLHLARQYSQRIKSTTPVAGQHSQRSLPCVVEEESSDNPNLMLPLLYHDKASSLPLSPTYLNPSTASLACSSPVSPGQARSHSPLSPREGFDWPDVRELRSKYSEHGPFHRNPISRSHSTPDQMFDGMRRHSSLTVPPYRSRGGREASREEHSTRLHRANSLDPRLGTAQMSELQQLQDQVSETNLHGYYVAAEAPLPNDPEHKILVVEKLPETKSAPAGTTTESKEEEDDNYVQIRSPTSREKISIMAVIDRCRAYQESDEYKQRQESKAKSESARSPDLEKASEFQKLRASSGFRPDAGLSSNSNVKHLREKFQSLS